MALLYAPWRNDYSKSSDDKKNDNNSSTSCVFCTQLQEKRDDHYFIIKRYNYVFVTMNIYPYNAGHSMVLPLEHKTDLLAMHQEARSEFIEVVAHSIEIIKNSLKADAINTGLNLGKIAGGSIDHLHMHIVPRWQGDASFMPITAATKVISFDMHEIYALIKKGFEQYG